MLLSHAISITLPYYLVTANDINKLPVTCPEISRQGFLYKLGDMSIFVFSSYCSSYPWFSELVLNFLCLFLNHLAALPPLTSSTFSLLTPLLLLSDLQTSWSSQSPGRGLRQRVMGRLPSGLHNCGITFHRETTLVSSFKLLSTCIDKMAFDDRFSFYFMLWFIYLFLRFLFIVFYLCFHFVAAWNLLCVYSDFMYLKNFIKLFLKSKLSSLLVLL